MSDKIYDRFEKLLKRDGMTTYQVAKVTGISTASFTGWKQGKWNFKPDKLQKIADFFDVTVDYLINGESDAKEEQKYYLNDETAKAAQEIFENKELKALFDTARDADPKDIRTAAQLKI